MAGARGRPRGRRGAARQGRLDQVQREGAARPRRRVQGRPVSASLQRIRVGAAREEPSRQLHMTFADERRRHHFDQEAREELAPLVVVVLALLPTMRAAPCKRTVLPVSSMSLSSSKSPTKDLVPSRLPEVFPLDSLRRLWLLPVPCFSSKPCKIHESFHSLYIYIISLVPH